MALVFFKYEFSIRKWTLLLYYLRNLMDIPKFQDYICKSALTDL